MRIWIRKVQRSAAFSIRRKGVADTIKINMNEFSNNQADKTIYYTDSKIGKIQYQNKPIRSDFY